MSTPEIPAFEDWVKDHPEVVDVQDRISTLREANKDVKALPEFRGKGRDKIVFGVGKYALKIQQLRPETPFAQQVSPLRRSLGARGVEQLVAVSHRQQVMVTDFLPGIMPARMQPDALRQRYVTPDSVDALVHTLDDMQERGVYVEGPKNILVSGDGFKVIDPAAHVMNHLTTNDYSQMVDLIAQYGWDRDADDLEYRLYSDAQMLQNVFASVRPRSRV